MLQDDIKSLLSTLISEGSISDSFISKFESIVKSIEQVDTNRTNIQRSIIGIYYLFIYQLFYEKNTKILSNVQKEIKSNVELFNKNELQDDKARKVLSELVKNQMILELVLNKTENFNNLLPFAQYKNTIEIEKMFNELEKMILDLPSGMKDLFINFFNENEKNREILESFNDIKFISSNEFSNFLINTLNSMNSKTSIVDTSNFNESFNNQIQYLFENFFLKFKEKKFSPIKFNVKLEKTLAEKNNESYFFYGDEIQNLGTDIDQKYISQLEINSKINNSILKSSGSNLGQLWEMVGSIVMNPVRIGIGIAEFPYIDSNTNKAYISVGIEQEVDLSESDNLYHQIQSMRITEISDKTNSRRQLIISEIAQSLDVPIELALYPTIIEEYLARNKGITLDFKIQKKKLRSEYYDVSKVVFDKLNGTITIPDDLEPIQHQTSFEMIPSQKSNFTQNKTVTLANEIVVGKIALEFTLLNSWYIAVALDLPNDMLLNQISNKIRKVEDKNENNIWKLRFTISKVLDIFEAESLLLDNIWKYIWHEKIPILPFDLLISFIGLTPSGAINKEYIDNESIRLARGVDILELDSLLRNGPFSILSVQNIVIGKLINFYQDPTDSQLYILYCTISEIEILKKLNRDYSPSSLAKLGKRIAKALSLKTERLEDELHPKHLLRYILFYSIQFNTQIDFSNIFEVIGWMITEFDFKKASVEKIKSIDYDNLLIEIEN